MLSRARIDLVPKSQCLQALGQWFLLILPEGMIAVALTVRTKPLEIFSVIAEHPETVRNALTIPVQGKHLLCLQLMLHLTLTISEGRLYRTASKEAR